VKPDRRPKISPQDRKRLEKLKDKLEDAQELGNTEETAKYQQEMLEIVKPIAERNITDIQRLQNTISKAINRSFAEIKKHHPELHAYLKSSINMSSGFKYTPPDNINWQTTP
jgi:hypothetical protein